jgi:hypothetical protein
MKTRRYSENSIKLLLALIWDLNQPEWKKDASILWHGFKVRAKILSTGDDTDRKISYSLYFKRKLFSKSQYLQDSKEIVSVPEICIQDFTLALKILPTSLEIYEKQNMKLTTTKMINLRKSKKQIKQGSFANTKAVSPEKISQKKRWISVSQDLNTMEFDSPFYDKDLLLWIYKSSYCKQEQGEKCAPTFEFFTKNLHPCLLKEGNFTCTEIAHLCPHGREGLKYRMRYKIVDGKGKEQYFYNQNVSEEGILDIIWSLRRMKKYQDWDEFDVITGLNSSLAGQMQNTYCRN